MYFDITKIKQTLYSSSDNKKVEDEEEKMGTGTNRILYIILTNINPWFITHFYCIDLHFLRESKF